MILRGSHRMLVYGMTGRQATFWTGAMLEYGARVVGGVSPGKAGKVHLGLPVFADGRSAKAEAEFDLALLFVPPLAAKSAAIDAIEAGAEAAVLLTEHIPTQDTMEMLAAARANGAVLVGPNTAGLATPGESFAGIMPVFLASVFKPGEVGVVSRSGSLGTLVCSELTRSGMGQSSIVGVGGDRIVGTTIREALELFERDRRTKAIAICGEIGGRGEEEAAEFAKSMTKPVAAYIAGRSAPDGKMMGHAGAIASGSKGTYAAKRRALESAGVPVADMPGQIPALLRGSRAGSVLQGLH